MHWTIPFRNGMIPAVSTESRGTTMFDKDQFIADCGAALKGDRTSRQVREVVGHAVADSASVVRGLGEPRQGGLDVLHRSTALTILNVLWPAGMIVMPHNHALWAVIGVYNGREDNILWRQLPEDANGRIEAAGARTLAAGDTVAFGADVIHSVVNPLGRMTGAIHVYGGDFFAVNRNEWDPETLQEKPYDMEKVLRMFAR
jgi:predicted metal-dependent enzyme (double-stranded beta helix superfamily)